MLYMKFLEVSNLTLNFDTSGTTNQYLNNYLNTVENCKILLGFEL